MQQRKQRITEFMKERSYKPLLFDELLTVLDVPENDVEIFSDIFKELEAEGKIFKTRKGRYGAVERMGFIAGRFQANERGFGFVLPDDEKIKDIYIPAEGVNGAMNNDNVLVIIVKDLIGAKNSEGEIVRVTNRANKIIVGTYEKDKYFGFVTPDDKRISGDILIPEGESKGAKPGFKVVVEIVKWPEKRRIAEGRVNEILGHKDEPGTDILSIIKSFKLAEVFPEDVIKQAESIQDSISQEMMEGRKDLRNLKIITIDGEDAKDLDDAVSLEKLPEGVYRLGVHIADVSHYVKERSLLDREAFKRGTSVYLVDRVIPMLPQKLSNGICSLNPSVDRLTLSVVMDINGEGKIVNHEIFESVININERMTYRDVNKILTGTDIKLTKKYKYIVNNLKTMEELALILREKRMNRGTIDFDFEETKVILDDKGKPIDVKKCEITIANRIIEEFMIVCNETVAETFSGAKIPFIYRIHEKPDLEKIQAFNDFIYNFGYQIKGINKIHPGALQEVLEKTKGKKEYRIISTVMLRSLQKAEYNHNNEGHFGLASENYCHFTSPIRRYPDLMIHRIIKEFLKGRMDAKKVSSLEEELPEIAKVCSQRERDAEEAERETVELKKVEYIKQYEGQTFNGIISGVTSFGIFVELDNTIEGLIRMGDLEDDYYVFNQKQYCLVGEKTKKVYRIGDTVAVKVVKADIALRQIDFLLVGKNKNKIKRKKAKAKVKIKVKVKEKRSEGSKHL